MERHASKYPSQVKEKKTKSVASWLLLGEKDQEVKSHMLQRMFVSVFVQSGYWQLWVGEPKQWHRCLRWRRQLPPPPSPRGAQPLLTGAQWLLKTFVCFFYLYIFAQSVLLTKAHGAESGPELHTFNFCTLSREEELTDFSLCHLLSPLTGH